MPFRTTIIPLVRALAERGYAEPTPVQDAVLEEGTETRDLLVSAQTGSGKTIAYGLAIAGTLLGEDDRFAPAGEPMALVVAPTRELAIQVTSELTWLYAHSGAEIVTCVGGMDPRAERRKLERGAHIVVGTPGRLRDHLERGALQIGALRALVLDEADEMLNLGFREDLEFLLEATPAERRTLLFSATLPKTIMAMAKRYQRGAMRIEVTGGASGHADIEYRAIRIAPNEVEHAIVNILREAESPSAIVFCNTRESVRHLSSGLIERGFSAVTLSGELGQAERNQAMQALRDGRARVCVATDVAARGIDLPSLGLVIHAELPSDAETLQHRSGRTGRAGRKGVSALLVPISRRRKAERLLSEANVEAVWCGAPSAETIRRLDEERLLADPLLTDPASEDELSVAKRLLETRSAEDLAAALVRLYRARLPAPEDVFDPGFGPDLKAREFAGKGRERGERGGKDHARGGPVTWFHMDVGRRNNADPKWILPLICRRGKITRQEIGAIKIYDRETKFEVAEAVAKKFAAAAEVSDGDDITISLADGPGGAEAPRGKFGKGERRGPGGPGGKFAKGGKGRGGDKPGFDQPPRAKKPHRKGPRPEGVDSAPSTPPHERPRKPKRSKG
ncbi:DEAD/DEAH box helicase [Jiella sp. MQZ9-1]|uniref:DEAD/DEAH box helicase n=1 Tax=Jiella flava TaxID=2816857 RepID=A0A939G2I9_9HYPH|nr:DEAD/DEAH box helicase [Jiella flava]MBO0663884.1 DEAD/DEAH box helicase [Jiella flava]MCD2472456.1 DEAD/DEAH box helicase [Jiella flava]